MTCLVFGKLSGQFPQTALEFSQFFLVQWLMSKRLQRGFSRRDKDEHIRSNRHVGDGLPVCCTCELPNLQGSTG